MNMNGQQQPFGGMSPMSVGQLQSGPGASINLSGNDLSSVFGAEVQSSGGLMVQFFYHRVRLGGKNTATGKYETRLAVALKPRGDMLTLAMRPITEEEAQRQFPGEWQQFKMYMDTPTRGTPLYELPGATQSMIGILVLGGIRSIEDLVNLPSDMCQQMGMDAMQAQKLAKIWIQRKSGAAEDINLSERQAELEASNARMAAELAELRQANAVQAQTIDTIRSMGLGAGGATGGAPAQGSDVVPAVPLGMQNFHGARAIGDDEDATKQDGSDIFSMTSLVNDMTQLKDPLQE